MPDQTEKLNNWLKKPILGHVSTEPAANKAKRADSHVCRLYWLTKDELIGATASFCLLSFNEPATK